MKTKLATTLIAAVCIGAVPASFAAHKKNHYRVHHRRHHQAIVASPTTPPPAPEVLPQMLVTLTHSSQFGNSLDGHWSNYLTQDQLNALGFEVGYGGDEFRLAGTLAHVFNTNNRIKITAEHFAQQPEFDFIVENHQQWVGQNAIGGIYEYLLNNNSLVKNLFFGGYYTHAETETFKEPLFFIGNQPYTDIERFAGANSADGQAGLTIAPWQTMRAAFTLYYDNTAFATQYQPDENVAGIGGGVDVQQLLSDHWKVAAFGSARQPFSQFGGGVYWLAHTRPGRRLEIGLSDQYITGKNIYANPDNRAMLTLNFSWGGNPCGAPASYANEDPDNLINWTMASAVRMPEVLVQKDGAVIKQ